VELGDYLRRNLEVWTASAAEYAAWAPRAWASEPNWGIWRIPESELRLLPDVAGKDVLDDGCGTGYFAAQLARLGGRCVGIDPTPAQLETARRLQDEFELWFPLVEAAGEQLPFPDGSFDLVLSEYGAALWADPHRWVAEAARVLRPGGELVFLTNSLLAILCSPDDAEATVEERLLQPQRGIYRMEWAGDPAVEFHLSHGEWIRLLHQNGFEVLDLVELYAPADAEGLTFFVDAEWAKRWPAEEVWKARKR
jgi:SAM-dependent methyltransferase